MKRGSYEYYIYRAQLAERVAFNIANRLAEIEERGLMREWPTVHNELREQCVTMTYYYNQASKAAHGRALWGN